MSQITNDVSISPHPVYICINTASANRKATPTVESRAFNMKRNRNGSEHYESFSLVRQRWNIVDFLTKLKRKRVWSGYPARKSRPLRESEAVPASSGGFSRRTAYQMGPDVSGLTTRTIISFSDRVSSYRVARKQTVARLTRHVVKISAYHSRRFHNSLFPFRHTAQTNTPESKQLVAIMVGTPR